jgi:glycosyltransferase involved in cell wall biosynthesis
MTNVAFPKISVISPSYNQAQYLETTIKSVLDQAYPNLEYIVIDGGSSDGSADIIRKYAGRLAHWVSEKDRGQSHAINKGFARSTGDILCWLNSDDFFEPGTLQYVADFFTNHPDVDVLCGGIHTVDPTGAITGSAPASYTGPAGLASYWHGYNMHQASIFWRRKVYEAIGPLNENLHLTMDFDYWLRMAGAFQIQSVDRILSRITMHPAQKTNDYSRYARAQLRTVLRHHGSPLRLDGWDVRLALAEHLARTCARKLLGRKTMYD